MDDLDLAPWEIVVRLALALVFSAAVGWEREAKNRPAGLRTHMLVALGSAGFTLVAMELLANLRPNSQAYPYDPVRIIATVVGGVGFLGAGAIMQSRGAVIGLTTAASLWLVAAMGMAFGCGYYLLGLLLSAFGLSTLIAMKVVQKRFINGGERKSPWGNVPPDETDEPADRPARSRPKGFDSQG